MAFATINGWIENAEADGFLGGTDTVFIALIHDKHGTLSLTGQNGMAAAIPTVLAGPGKVVATLVVIPVME